MAKVDTSIIFKYGKSGHTQILKTNPHLNLRPDILRSIAALHVLFCFFVQEQYPAEINLSAWFAALLPKGACGKAEPGILPC